MRGVELEDLGDAEVLDKCRVDVGCGDEMRR